LRLLTVHRILIASGIAVCLLYAGREVANYTDTHSATPLIHAALSVAAAVALALYLRSIRTL
jgi:membrane-associated phospholipid phosphatase